MDPKQKERILNLYKALLQFYFKSERKEPDLDDKPFTNLLDSLYPVLSSHKYYCNELFMSSIVWYLEDMRELPDPINEQQVDKLIKCIKETFEINKGIHFLIFPLQGSSLQQDISFSKFHIITKKDESAIIEQISGITGIDKVEVKNLLTHTQKSRSEDFLKSNIMLIEIEDQTETVDGSAYKLAQYSVDFFMLIHSAFGMEYNVLHRAGILEHENKHVAILSKDRWRCGHGTSQDAHLQCKIDLDFMKEEQYQKIFSSLFDSFALKNKADDLTYKFINSFLLFSRGMIQRKVRHDDSLALLLYITALESLITEGQQEKRIRLAVIVPQIICVEGVPSFKLAKIINELYKMRNNFVHAGQAAFFSYEDEGLNLLERITALTLLKYFDADSFMDVTKEQTRINAWMNYINNKFDSIIFGEQ